MEVTKETMEVNETKEMKPEKEKREWKGMSAKSQIVGATLLLTIVFLVEFYLMINYQNWYLLIVLLGLIALGAVYVLGNAIMLYTTEKEEKRQTHMEDIIRSEKASYIMVKAKFEELEEKLAIIQATSKIPCEEIINAQKGIAKVIITRNKENADAIINSNDQVLERLDAIDETQNTKFTGISKDQRLKLTEMANQTEVRLHDMLMQLKDMEIRLNQAIMQTGGKVVMTAPEKVMYESPRSIESPVLEETEEKAVVEDILEDILEDGVLDDYVVEGATEEAIVEEIIEDILEDGVVDNFVVEEESATPEVDLSDPNKAMSPNDIAALFASMGGAEEPVAEEPTAEEIIEDILEDGVLDNFVVEEVPVVEDPNEAMSPDDIAALFASMTGGTEEPTIEEPVEEVVEEEIPPMPDLSDPNRQLSSDEIAALIANL